MLVCLDTTVLILTQQSEPREGQEQLWKAAQKYEEWIRESECGILVPTPVVSEFRFFRIPPGREQIRRVSVPGRTSD